MDSSVRSLGLRPWYCGLSPLPPRGFEEAANRLATLSLSLEFATRELANGRAGPMAVGKTRRPAPQRAARLRRLAGTQLQIFRGPCYKIGRASCRERV